MHLELSSPTDHTNVALECNKLGSQLVLKVRSVILSLIQRSEARFADLKLSL